MVVHTIHQRYAIVCLPMDALPEMIVIGWMFWDTSFSASLSSSPASTTTEVVPSPTSAS